MSKSPSELFWDSFAEIYSNLIEIKSLESIKKHINDYFNKINKKINYSELACGSGSLSFYIRENFREKIKEMNLYDISQEMIKRSKKKIFEENEDKFISEKKENLLKINIFKKNAEEIILEKNKEDLIIASLLLHLVGFPEKIFKEIFLKIKKKGIFIISILGPKKNNSFFNVQDEILNPSEKKEENDKNEKGGGIFAMAEDQKIEILAKKYDFEIFDFYQNILEISEKDGLLDFYKGNLNRYKKSGAFNNFQLKELFGQFKEVVEKSKIKPLEICFYHYMLIKN